MLCFFVFELPKANVRLLYAIYSFFEKELNIIVASILRPIFNTFEKLKLNLVITTDYPNNIIFEKFTQ